MKKFLTSLLLISMLTGCQKNNENEYPNSIIIKVKNSLSVSRTDASVSIKIADLNKMNQSINEKAFVFFAEGVEVPSQVIDTDADGQFDKILLVMDFSSEEEKTVTLNFAEKGEKIRLYEKRTQAELAMKADYEFVDGKYMGGYFKNVDDVRVPDAHTDHSYLFKYEGPGWESDKIGYRFYLDWRNATDIFGKKTSDMVLKNVGQDGFDSYHNMAEWGMDILKVGHSLGIGSVGMWSDKKANRVEKTDSVICKIPDDGPIYSRVHTEYYGWKIGSQSYELISDLSIMAGSRMTKHELDIKGNPENLCTGFAKYEGCQLLKSNPDSEDTWQYLALYGKQSLAEDDLGIGVLYRSSDLIRLTEDELNHVIILKPSNNGKLTYYFLGAWIQEPMGIKNITDFKNIMENLVDLLNHPVVVDFR